MIILAVLFVALNAKFPLLRTTEKLFVRRAVRIMARQADHRFLGPRIENPRAHRVGERGMRRMACVADLHCVGDQELGLI